MTYSPFDWNWVIGDDTSRAWSSAVGAWVQSWPDSRVTRIGAVADLDAVLRPLGIRSPRVTADDVRAECSRRMCAAVGARDAAHLAIIISNAQRESTHLYAVRLGIPGVVEGRNWTTAESARAAALYAANAEIDRLRGVSNVLETSLPDDYDNDSYWVA